MEIEIVQKPSKNTILPKLSTSTDNPNISGTTIYVVKNYFSFTIGEKGKELLYQRLTEKELDKFLRNITYAIDDFLF